MAGFARGTRAGVISGEGCRALTSEDCDDECRPGQAKILPRDAGPELETVAEVSRRGASNLAGQGCRTRAFGGEGVRLAELATPSWRRSQ